MVHNLWLLLTLIYKALSYYQELLQEICRIRTGSFCNRFLSDRLSRHCRQL